jgi:glycosyltransferase involved in cell wall biosynthesis
MKIAVSTRSDVSMNDNGTSVRAKRVFELLQKKYDCTLITSTMITRGRNRSKSDNVKVIRPSKLWDFQLIPVVLRSRLDRIYWNFQLIPVVLRNRFDLVYCSYDFPGFFTYFALAKLYNFKIVFEAHGNMCLEAELGLREPSSIDKVRLEICKWYEKLVVKHADCVIALSLDICNYYGRFNNCIVLVPAFVDEKKFRPRESPREWQSDYDEGKIIGLIGAFVHKGINISTLDFVYRNIDEFDERIKFVVIGACDYKTHNERIEYTGYLNDFQDYADRLTRLDAVLVASRHYTSGPLNKILEPMACSVPVFTTPVGAAGLDHVTAGEDIFICDESEIAAKVNESLFDIELMEIVGKNARRTIETYYSATANERAIIKVLERVGIQQ